jgi:mono/diheme cytochrome c family protein
LKNGKALCMIGCATLALAGCHTDMWVQPKHHAPYQENTLFENKMSSRPLPEGVVSADTEIKSEAQETGYEGMAMVRGLPAKLTLGGKEVDTKKDLKTVLKRGQERFFIACSHCHGADGSGNGMIAQRGLSLKRPPGNYHTDRLRSIPEGHLYNVITNGFGVMYSQKSRVKPDDRWAIVAYIRALQMSQNMPEASLTEKDKAQIETLVAEYKKSLEPAEGHSKKKEAK